MSEKKQEPEPTLLEFLMEAKEVFNFDIEIVGNRIEIKPKNEKE